MRPGRFPERISCITRHGGWAGLSSTGPERARSAQPGQSQPVLQNGAAGLYSAVMRAARAWALRAVFPLLSPFFLYSSLCLPPRWAAEAMGE
jgi:hypothetical protein